MSTTDRPTAFDRTTAAVGHLEHPLYDDEHRRDVWNEASAVGLQAMTWALLIAATAGVWLGGRAAMPYVLTMTMIAGAVGVLVMTYAQRHGVDPWHVPGTGRLRWALCGVIGALLLIGMLRTLELGPGVDDVAGAVAGGVVGAGAVLLLMLLAVRVARRRAPQGED